MGSFCNPTDENEDAELYETFLTSHESRLRSLGIPECKWRSLCRKLSYSIFDAGDNFMFQEESSEDSDAPSHLRVFTKCAMRYEDPEHIYLIDHAFTYTLETARQVLAENTSLVERMAGIMEIPTGDDHPESEVIRNILDKMWQFNNCYLVRRESQGACGCNISNCQHKAYTVTCWYILDEFGSRIHYSDEPTFEMVPFFFCGDNTMYSLLYPKSDVSEGEEVTVLFPGYRSSLSEDMKRAVLYPWVPDDFSNIDFSLSEPPVEYFASGRYQDVLPESGWHPSLGEISAENQLIVYSDFDDVNEYLTHPSFRITNEKSEANILWLCTRESNIKELIEKFPNFCYISQFPSEQILTNKDLLAAVCRRSETASFNMDTLEAYPEWLPATFNLKTEVPQFMSYFQNREKRNLDNIWICKPFNLARGLNICITDNLSQIIRISEARPTVACKYITDPVLYPSEGNGLVKIDLRYIVLLKSTDPLEVYLYEHFWIRFANKPFALEDYDDYERHFTVMNYGDFPLQQMYCHDFIQKFEDYYTSHKWSDIQEQINKMIKDMFVAALSKEPPAGLGKFTGSRAVYGLDIMLKWDRNHDVPQIKPVMLEVNWMPDCKRACQYYLEFYNEIFSVLFLDDTKDKHVLLL